MHLLVLHLLLSDSRGHLVRNILTSSFVLQEGLLGISPAHAVVHIVLGLIDILVLVICVSSFLVLPALGTSLFPSLDHADYADDDCNGSKDGTDNHQVEASASALAGSVVAVAARAVAAFST